MTTPSEKIDVILTELADLERRREELLAALPVQRGLLEIKCASCGESHAINQLTAIQTHWYTPPHGCSGGDYWNIGEMLFLCPETAVRNRLLFNNDDVPWEERRNYSRNPREQFRHNFGKLFKTITDEYDHRMSGLWVNNFYVDQNRALFGLVEKVAKN